MEDVFRCRRCGFCCQGETTVSLNSEDQQRMLKLLQITREEAMRKYWRCSGGVVQMQTIDGHCVFYNNGCGVHQGRPWRCKEWPLVKALLIEESNFETIRSSCPGVNKEASYNDICRAVRKGGCINIPERGKSDEKERHDAV